MAYENLTKPHIQAALTARMDNAGITVQWLLKVLDERLSATKAHFSQTDGKAEEKTSEDYAVRHRYLDTALKLRDMVPAEKKKLQHDFNISEEEAKAARERVNRLLSIFLTYQKNIHKKS